MVSAPLTHLQTDRIQDPLSHVYTNACMRLWPVLNKPYGIYGCKATFEEEGTVPQYLQELVSPKSIFFSPLLFPVQTKHIFVFSGLSKNRNEQHSGARSPFRRAVSTLWNRLPDTIQKAEDIASFWRLLKSYLFSTP